MLRQLGRAVLRSTQRGGNGGGGHGGHGHGHEFPPVPSTFHTWGAKLFGATMWLWIFYRASIDGPAVMGWEHPWEHGGHHGDDHGDDDSNHH